MPKTPDDVLRLIEKAAAERATFIDLGMCGLTHFPEELVELKDHLEWISLGVWYYDDEERFRLSNNHYSANSFSGNTQSWKTLKGLTKCLRLSVNGYLGNKNIISFISYIRHLDIFDISTSQIGDEGATAIAKLNKLTSLNISNNQIGDVGAIAIAKLNKLTSLNISENQIGDVAATAIANLKKLTSLTIYNNQIGDVGATAIAKLNNLTTLYIYNNQIGDVGATAIAKLNNLTTLYISNNQIGAGGATAIAKLNNLTTLYISNNQISSPQFFKVLLANATELDHIISHGNPVRGLPSEIQDDIPALRSWFQELDADKEPLYTSDYKILLCGNSGVGKSTILDRLQGKTFDPEKKSTHGVRIEEIALNEHTRSYVWDFGGQEIYHSTHRLFLKGDAVALVVWDQTTEKQTVLSNRLRPGDHYYNRTLAYWLRTLQYNGGEHQIVLLQNKLDEDGHEAQQFNLPNWEQLRNNTFSAASADDFEVDILRRHLLAAAKNLRNWKMQVPRSWWGVRQEILDAAQDEKTKKWTRNYFKERCAFHEVADNTVNSLLNYLHDSGILFRDNQLFPDEIIINQQWALDAIYTVLDPEQKFYKKLEEKGTFTGSDIFAEWEKEGYAANDRALFLNLMVAAHLCFSINRKENTPLVEQVFLHPALLRKQAHNLIYRFWDKIAVEQVRFLRYQHKHLDFYTIQRFITELGKKTELENIWRNGLDLSWANSYAYVQADIPKGTILVKTHGPEASYLMDGIRNQFRNIHGERPVELQVSINGVDFVSTEEIEKQQKLPDAKSALAIDERTAVPLQPLLWVLQRDEEANLDQKLPDVKQDAAMAQAKRAGQRIFISYAKEDKTLVDAFVDLLSTYERNKKIQIYYDKEIHHRSGWDEQLQTEMREAEAFVVFASTDYFANRKEYILDEEVPLMYERHQEEKIPVFPILVNRPALLPFGGSVLGSISLLGKDLCLRDDDDPRCLNKSMAAAQKILEQLGVS